MPYDSFILGQIVAVSTKPIFTYLTSGPQEFHIHSYWQAYFACCLCSYPRFESLESSIYTLSPVHASVSDYYPNFPSLINSSLSSQIPFLVLCQQMLLMNENSFFVLLTIQDQHVYSSWWYLYISISGCPVSTPIFEIRVNIIICLGFLIDIEACWVKWQVRELPKEIYLHRTAKHFLSGSTIILYGMSSYHWI